MERLTNTAWRNFDPWECCGQDNFCTRGCHEKGGCNNGCIVPKLYGRLAAYEDTGLEPEEIYEVRFLIAAKRDPQKLARLRELVLAEEAGRLVVLPCKVGYAAYWLHNGIVSECIVHRIQMNRKGLFICLKSKVSHGAFRVDIALGKTVFLTREEAEAALAGKGGDEHRENRPD